MHSTYEARCPGTQDLLVPIPLWGGDAKTMFCLQQLQTHWEIKPRTAIGMVPQKKVLKDHGKAKALVVHYDDSNGQRKWKGTGDLRGSELGPHLGNTDPMETRACFFLLADLLQGAKRCLPIIDFNPILNLMVHEKNQWIWKHQVSNTFALGKYPITIKTLMLRCYPPQFGLKFVEIFHSLISDKLGMPELPLTVPSAEETFASLEFSDVWSEASIVSLCHYLRSGIHLKIPPSFRELLPAKL